MRQRIVIGLLALVVIGGVIVGIVVMSKDQESSVEAHLEGFYSAQSTYHALRSPGSTTFRSTFLKWWYKLRGKDAVEYLNQMARHQTALEELGYLETRAFAVSNRSAVYVQSNVWHRAYLTERTNMVNGLAKIWIAATPGRIWVSVPRPDLPKWEELIRQADMPEIGK